MIRSLIALGAMYFFYTIPLTAAVGLASSDNLTELFPGLVDLKESYISADLLSALIGALIWAFFFA